MRYHDIVARLPGIRAAAKVAFLLTATNALVGAWDAWIKLTNINSQSSWQWVKFPLFAVGLLVDALFPLLYLAVYRNQSSLFVSKSSRFVSGASALILCWSMASRIPGWYRILAPDIEFVPRLSLVLNELADIAVIFLLIVMLIKPNAAEEAAGPASTYLLRSSAAAFLAWGTIASFNVFRMFMVPWIYKSAQLAASDPLLLPPASVLWKEVFSQLLASANLAAIAFVVYRGARPPNEISTESESAAMPT